MFVRNPCVKGWPARNVAVIPTEVEGSALTAVIPSEVEGSALVVIPSAGEGSALLPAPRIPCTPIHTRYAAPAYFTISYARADVARIADRPSADVVAWIRHP